MILTNSYSEFKNNSNWKKVSTAIDDLVKNKDLELTTDRDLIIWYIVKSLHDE